MRRPLRLLTIASVALGVGLVFSLPASAVNNLSDSYLADGPAPVGSLVSLTPSKDHHVTLANTSNGKQLVGVVVRANSSLLAADVASNKVQVALGGIATTSVSTLNGSIAAGDQIGVSPLSGVGMKAEPGQRVIGVAQKAFNENSAGANRSKIDTDSGKNKEVSVGFIPIAIHIGTKNAAGSSDGASGIQRFVSNLVGHQVSMLSAVMSGIVALVALAALIALIYGTIRGSLISIGRNPLAKSSIFESMAQVMAMSALIVGLAIIIIYLLLH